VASLLARASAGDHFVQFYEDDPSLLKLLARFVGAGLDAGDRVVVIATPSHREGLVGQLAQLGDPRVEGAIASGSLLLVDARQTLDRFMVAGFPDRTTFNEVLAELFGRATNGHAPVRVRAYGEMVDLLWRDGARSAALLLEDLWNDAARAHSFSLLCAYSLAHFFTSPDGSGFADVCRAHGHVLPLDAPAPSGRAAPSTTDLGELRERVRVLEAENAHLRDLQLALRHSHSERQREEAARFRLLVDSVKDYAIFMLDPAGVVVTWNGGAERIKGYRAQEIVGCHFSVFYPPEDVAAGKCEYELTVAVEDGRFEDEGWRVRKDGSLFWANVVITTLRDPSGAVVGFAKVTRDLTERVHAEKERLQLARMEEAERRKDEFLAIIGHELRNPLAPLVAAAKMIRLRGGQATEQEMGAFDRQLLQMSKIVADLLHASSAMRDDVALCLKTVRIAEVVASAVDLATPLVARGQHKLVVEVPSEGLEVHVDSERMAQVLGNVLNNAAKYTPPGGTIRVEASGDESSVILRVEDNGQGMKPELLARVFDLFAQGDQGIERPAGGLGVGLAVARWLVRAHGGRISAESGGVGRGSCFTIRLPRPSAVAVARGAVAEATPALGSQRILIADDNEDTVEMMRALLEYAGHDVRVAFDGIEALAVCEAFRPETVFLDIGLPGIDGYEVARRMRAIPSGQDARIVAVSGYARDEDRARALASGFTAHLAKPLDLDRIPAILQVPVR
jgi:PAS domain S-box-containing protein